MWSETYSQLLQKKMCSFVSVCVCVCAWHSQEVEKSQDLNS